MHVEKELQRGRHTKASARGGGGGPGGSYGRGCTCGACVGRAQGEGIGGREGSEDERDRRTRGIGGREGSEDERDRRRSNGQGEPAHVCARGPACARGSLYAHASRGSWLA
jgi:hypothetical protein